MLYPSSTLNQYLEAKPTVVLVIMAVHMNEQNHVYTHRQQNILLQPLVQS